MLWTVAALYIAGVIGAGFASGQEVVQFFARFGMMGLVGVVIALILLSTLGGVMIKKCHNAGFKNYQDLLVQTTKSGSAFFDITYTFFILLGLAIMLAGTDALLEQLTSLKVGRYLTAVLVILPMIYGPGKVLKITEKLVPVIIILMVYVAASTIKFSQIQIPIIFYPKGILYSLLYVGYNLGFSMAVFAGISQLIPSDQAAMRGGIVGGLVLGLLIALVTLTLFSSSNSIQAYPIPMLAVAENIGKIPGLLYTLTIWLAMYTTALAHTVAVTTRISRGRNNNTFLHSLVVISSGLVIARVGFVSLLQVTYPLFGLVGLFLLLKLLHLPS